ncbi:MAG: biotin transporter BioY [Chloroflexota bacterium]|nr:MAG: biotin transporter BioY [Chloroflexota bacterium]
MLRTLPRTRDYGLAARLAAVLAFTCVTAVAARLALPFEPVPFTLQPLAVLLAGLTLGARDGALSQLLYVALIASGLPVDSRGLGTAALFGPTGGYLIGFIAAAWVAGYLAESGARRLWRRWLAGVAGIAAIYLVGVPYLRLVTGLEWQAAWASGAALFLVPDLMKALIAAALAESGRALLLRYLN